MGRRATWVALVIVVSACGGSRHPVAASTGTGNGSDGGSGPSTAPVAGSGSPTPDAGTPPSPPPPNADGGSAGGTPPDAGQPTFALGIVIQGQGVVTSDPAGIECAKACAGQFAAGEKIVLSAKAVAGWSFSGFRGACFGTDCTIVKLAFTQFVEVVFTQDPPPAGVSSYTIVAIPPVDAFNSDAIPVHLLTREALGVYLDKLAPGGVIMLHLSNRYLELESVVAALTRERGLAARIGETNVRGFYISAASWAGVARSDADFGPLAREWRPARNRRHVAPWTDDFSSVLSVWGK